MEAEEEEGRGGAPGPTAARASAASRPLGGAKVGSGKEVAGDSVAPLPARGSGCACACGSRAAC